ncbi:MAG: CHAT domain-containing protein, partial [Cytophagales bacterium]
LGVEIYELLLKDLAKEGGSKYSNAKLQYQKVIKSNFKEGSFYPVRLKAVEFDSKLNNDKTKNLEKDANDLLTNTKELPKNNSVTVNVLEFLTELATYERRYSNVEGYLKSIIEIKNNLYGEDAPESHLARLKLANYYLDYTNKIPEALKIYDESFTKIVAPQIGNQHQDILEIVNHIGSLYELTDEYGKADSVLEKSIKIAQAKYDNKDVAYATQLNNVARIQIKLGEFQKASAKVDEAVKILKDKESRGKNRELHLIEALETRATLQGVRGLFDEAEETLALTGKMIRNFDNTVGIDELATAKQLTSLLILLGDYKKADELLTTLIEEYQKLYGNQSLRLIEPLVNKGRLILAKGDYTEADKVAQRAHQIALAVYGDNSSKTAATQKLLGDIDYAIGDYDKAEENIQKALASQERQFGRNHIEVAKSLAQLSLIKFYKGEEFAQVEKMMLEAKKIMGDQLGLDNPQYADILKNVAIINIAANKYNNAFVSLTQAENIWRSKTGSKNNINAAAIFTLTADVFYQMKSYTKAEDFYNQARGIYEKYFSRTHPEYVKILSKQAKVYFMQKEFKKAKRNIEEALGDYETFIKKYFPALSEREKTKYWNTIKNDFEFYNTLAFGNLEDFKDLSGKVYNYQLLTKALLLSSSIKVRERIMNSPDESLKKLYNDWIQKKEFLTNALSMSTEQLSQNAIDLPTLNNEVEKLEATLSEKSELFGQNFENKKITYENVQKSINTNEVAIEMVRYRHFDHNFTDSVVYVALYVKNDGARPKVVPLPEGYRMDRRFYPYYRNCITGQVTDLNSYRVFWEPISKAIGINSAVYFSPDGVYNLINLEAIPIPESGGKHVIDNASIVMVNNTKDLYLRKLKGKSVPSNSATLFGNPSFYVTASNSNAIPSLPGTEKEVNELQDILEQKGWKTFEYLNKSATEERVKEQESPKVFHIATHGFYLSNSEGDDAKQMISGEAQLAQNPLLKCGLLLRGAGDVMDKSSYNYNIESGILTAYEAMSLNLDKTDLVVLSACETGLGDVSNGEGVYGLQRAFLVAGAKVLIMSMFKVDDEATQKLILNFYKKWLTTGNMRQSFVDAKKELRVEYPEPIYWGAFMMIGLE